MCTNECNFCMMQEICENKDLTFEDALFEAYKIGKNYHKKVYLVKDSYLNGYHAGQKSKTRGRKVLKKYERREK